MLKLLTEKDFDRMYEIMEQSFPEDEYRPYDEQKALFEKSEYKVYAWQNTDGCTVAFMSVWYFWGFAYIEHFAVDKAFRNMGIGTKMLSEISAKSGKLLCLEVEPPEGEIAKKRIAFYERNGFCLNSYPYMQPSISKGRRSIPLMIMTYGRNINTDEFNLVKEMLYTEVYKVTE